MSYNKWPAYRVGNPDYIHALGVIASVYNLLEFRFRSLFPMFTGLPIGAGYRLFAKQNNPARLELIGNTIDAIGYPEEIKDHVKHFLEGYRICTENRNILMHSTVVYVFGPDDDACPVSSPPGSQPLGVKFQKSPKSDPYQINTYQLTLAEIREQADALKAIEIFGDKLYWHVLRNYETKYYLALGFPEDAQFALPSKPALPPLLKAAQSDTLRG